MNLFVSLNLFFWCALRFKLFLTFIKKDFPESHSASWFAAVFGLISWYFVLKYKQLNEKKNIVMLLPGII